MRMFMFIAAILCFAVAGHAQAQTVRHNADGSTTYDYGYVPQPGKQGKGFGTQRMSMEDFKKSMLDDAARRNAAMHDPAEGTIPVRPHNDERYRVGDDTPRWPDGEIRIGCSDQPMPPGSKHPCIPQPNNTPD